MTTRPATEADMPALVELSERFEIALFGRVEQSAGELREWMDQLPPWHDSTRLITAGDRVIAFAARGTTDTVLVGDPVNAGEVYAELLDWFATGMPAKVPALSGDEELLQALDEQGWTHTVSSFELFAAVDGSLLLPRAEWPDGVTVHGYDDPADAAAVHHLIYTDAAWADVPGHPHRDFDEWHRIFVGPHTVADQQVLARRGDRLVGVAMGRIWDDGTGWVTQLATAKDERGKGLGRALLAQSLRLRREAGATSLGLSVQAANRGALAMYLAAGLEIDREWMTFEP